MKYFQHNKTIVPKLVITILLTINLMSYFFTGNINHVIKENFLSESRKLFEKPEKKNYKTIKLRDKECKTNFNLTSEEFSKKGFVSEYLKFSICEEREALSFVNSSVGEAGDINIVPNFPVKPPSSLVCEGEGEDLLLLYMVPSSSRVERDRVRRLWAGQLGRESRCVFLLPHLEEVEQEEVRDEVEKQQDIVFTGVERSGDNFLSEQAVAGLYLAHTHCPLARYIVLVQPDVFINQKIMNKFARRERFSANRIYGDLYKTYSPNHDPLSFHYIPSDLWPWPLYPPFLGPEVIIFSSDTLPHLLLAVPNVPVFKIWEIWLTGLVGMHTNVVRIGMKKFFKSLKLENTQESFNISTLEQVPSCYWQHYGAITSLPEGSEVDTFDSWLLNKMRLICDL